MWENDLTDTWMYRHRWPLFFSAISIIFAIPMLLIVGSPVLHAAGLHDLASAGDNMNAATDGQEAAMGSTAASAAAGAAAAGSGSGSENGRGRDDDALAPLTPSSGSEDDLAPLTPSSDADAGTGTDAGKGTDAGTNQGTDDGKSLTDRASDWIKEKVNDAFGDENVEVSPKTSLDPETSKPPEYDHDSWGTVKDPSESSGSKSSGSDAGSSSSSSSGDSSSGSSGDSSGSKGTGESTSDWFGKGAGNYIDILTGGGKK